MKKKVLALVLSLSLCFSLTPAVFAAPADGSAPSPQEELAGKLKSLGLFLGDETGNFNLDKTPTRVEALVMLIRALGQDGEARAAGKTHPFADVPEWADGYVSLAYAKGYTKGISDSQFGSETAASCEMYLTFLLRALGYTEGAEGDFTYDQPFYPAYEAGVFLSCVDPQDFRRSDVVEATVAALFAGEKGSGRALHQRLEESGAFSAADFAAAFPSDPFGDEKALNVSVVKALSDQLAGEASEEDAVKVQLSMVVGYTQAGGVTSALALVETVTARPGEDGTPVYSGSLTSRTLTFSADTGALLAIEGTGKTSAALADRYQFLQNKLADFLYALGKQDATALLQGGTLSGTL